MFAGDDDGLQAAPFGNVDIDTFRMTMPGLQFRNDSSSNNNNGGGGAQVSQIIAGPQNSNGFEAFIPGEYFLNQSKYVFFVVVVFFELLISLFSLFSLLRRCASFSF